MLAPGAIDTNGLEVSDDDMAELLRVDPDAWNEEVPAIHQHSARFGDRLPGELDDQLSRLERQLNSA